MQRLRSLSGQLRRGPKLRISTFVSVLAAMLLVPLQSSVSQTRPGRTAPRSATAKSAATPTAAACTTAVAGKLPVQLAIRHFVRQADPKPMRFLVAAGTDSALSEMGAKVLQEFGPMYYYAGSESAKLKLRERLLDVGPYPVLLVVKRPSPKPTPVSEIIRLGGHYVTGEHDGKNAASLDFKFVCGSAGWEMRSVSGGEKSTPAPSPTSEGRE